MVQHQPQGCYGLFFIVPPARQVFTSSKYDCYDRNCSKYFGLVLVAVLTMVQSTAVIIFVSKFGTIQALPAGSGKRENQYITGKNFLTIQTSKSFFRKSIFCCWFDQHILRTNISSLNKWNPRKALVFRFNPISVCELFRKDSRAYAVPKEKQKSQGFPILSLYRKRRFWSLRLHFNVISTFENKVTQ